MENEKTEERRSHAESVLEQLNRAQAFAASPRARKLYRDACLIIRQFLQKNKNHRSAVRGWICGHTIGPDCGRGQWEVADFVTLDEGLAVQHAEKFKNSQTVIGWHRQIDVF